MANDDVRKMLEHVLNEISSFLEQTVKDREHVIESLNRLDDDISNAERDHRRIQRAINALNGDDEPTKAAVSALIDPMESAGQIGKGSAYYPGR